VLGNDLSAAAHRCGVNVERIEERLRQCGALAAGMTGSGSAVFGLFESEEQASTALMRMRQFTGSRGLSTTPVENSPLPHDAAHGAVINDLHYMAIAPFCQTGVEFVVAEQPS
jgi:4-diphosphocytidyl-2C-methyl-D-erythritol kinase